LAGHKKRKEALVEAQQKLTSWDVELSDTRKQLEDLQKLIFRLKVCHSSSSSIHIEVVTAVLSPFV